MTDNSWIEPYHNKKHKEELEAYAVFVTGGYAWKVSSSGKTYCSGKVKEVK